MVRSWENSTLSRAEGWGRVGVHAAHCLVPLRVSPSNPSEMSLIKCGQVSIHGHCLFHSSWLAFHSSNLRLQTQAFKQSPLYISHCKSRLSETPSSGLASACALVVGHDSTSLILPSVAWITQLSDLYLRVPSSRKHCLDCPGWVQYPQALSVSLLHIPNCVKLVGLNYLFPEPN